MAKNSKITRGQMVNKLIDNAVDSADRHTINELIHDHYENYYSNLTAGELEQEYNDVFDCDDDEYDDDDDCDCGDDCNDCDDCAAEGTDEVKHKCHCDISTIMRNGCVCGGC